MASPTSPAATRPLAELDTVPWETLEHAYGSAADTPGRLQKLASPDEAERKDAQYWLSASIHHQGSLYSASAPSIPFLLGLAVDVSCPSRAWIVRFLVDLAVRRPNGWLWRGFLLEESGFLG